MGCLEHTLSQAIDTMTLAHHLLAFHRSFAFQELFLAVVDGVTLKFGDSDVAAL